MKLFILMFALSATDMDVEGAEPIWVFESQADCHQVAETLNRNSDTEYVFCVETE